MGLAAAKPGTTAQLPCRLIQPHLSVKTLPFRIAVNRFRNHVAVIINDTRFNIAHVVHVT